MDVLTHDEEQLAFRMRHVTVGVALSILTGAIGLIYLALTAQQPNRGPLAVLLLTAILASAGLPLSRIVGGRHSMLFLYGWSLVLTALISAGVVLDGGADSPLTTLYVLPLVYAATAYPPRAVLALGGVVVASYLAVSSGGVVAGERLFLYAAVLTLITSTCAVASRNQRQRFDTQARLARALADLAHRDGLTGCLNHRAFRERLASEVERSARYTRALALCVIDLDDFKLVNDAHGHPSGDALLELVGQTLRAVTRDSDVVGRVGGDEFAVLLPETDLDGATALGERIREEIARICDPLPVTVSVGVATLPPATGADELIEQADTAVYRSKRAGRNRVTVFGDVDDGPQASSIDLVLRRRVQEIIDQDAVAVVFQPVVSLIDGTVAGYEALARIEGSHLPPDRWLEMAEQVGLRNRLEAHMWAVALKAGSPPGDAVLFLNASPAALSSGALRVHRADLPANVTIEVSESSAVRDYAVLTASLGEWADAGVRVAVDDMGAGHANFDHVLRLAPHYLKLDRSLVTDLPRSPARQALITAISSFAAGIDSMVIAEGVETEEEAAALAHCGVAWAQGWLFAPAAPPWVPVSWRPAQTLRPPTARPSEGVSQIRARRPSLRRTVEG